MFLMEKLVWEEECDIFKSQDVRLQWKNKMDYVFPGILAFLFFYSFSITFDLTEPMSA